MSKSTSIKINNKEILEKAIEVAIAKDIIVRGNKAQFVEILLNDFLNNQALSDLNRMNMISDISNQLAGELRLIEERFSNRTLKLVSELAIQLSITNQMIYDYIIKYENKFEAEEKYQEFRVRAVEQLRENKSVLKSTDLYNNEDTNF